MEARAVMACDVRSLSGPSFAPLGFILVEGCRGRNSDDGSCTVAAPHGLRVSGLLM